MSDAATAPNPPLAPLPSPGAGAASSANFQNEHLASGASTVAPKVLLAQSMAQAAEAIERTAARPHEQLKELSRIKAKYIKERHGIDVQSL